MRKILLILCLTVAVRAAGVKVLTTDTLWDWRTVADPEISPDGRQIVYTLGWNDRMNDAMHTNLWIVSAGGGDERPLTQGSYKDTSPRWSADGKRLAYLSNRSGRVQVWVRWMDTGQEAMMTDLQQAPANIAWSPDGKWIAYSARVPSRPEWQVPAPERPAGAKWADPPIVVTRLRWRSDGSGLIPPGYTHLFVVPSTGGAPRQLTSGDFNHVAAGGRAGGDAIAWTPDGQSILTSCLRIPDAEYSLEGPEIWAFAVKDGAARQLTHRPGPDGNPTPSPDGRKIAYTGNDFKHQSYTVTHLYVMDADGTNPRQLTAKLDRDVQFPRWSADSRTVYFVAENRGASHLYRATLDGTVKAVTSDKYRYSTGYAESEGFSIASNGRVAILRSSPSEPADLVTFPVDQPDTAQRLTASNDGLLADRKLGSVEEIVYDSFDGRSMQGWIVKPPDFDPAKKYPLILDIHGGPHAMYGIEFNHQRQVFAGRGFVVLYTNPRGSTGYGEEFGNIIHTKYPGDDYQDLMTGVDVLLKKGYIDPKRLAVTGGSGGGLLTAWIIGQTARFAVAVSQYPVTNWITQVGTADSGYTHAAVWMKAMPWENPEQYLKRSPIFYAKNFKTPTMVITGEQDLRTPMAESEELYFALKAQRVPAVLVRIPDEPHGIRGAHPSHRIAKMDHILGWIGKYTRSPEVVLRIWRAVKSPWLGTTWIQATIRVTPARGSPSWRRRRRSSRRRPTMAAGSGTRWTWTISGSLGFCFRPPVPGAWRYHHRRRHLPVDMAVHLHNPRPIQPLGPRLVHGVVAEIELRGLGEREHVVKNRVPVAENHRRAGRHDQNFCGELAIFLAELRRHRLARVQACPFQVNCHAVELFAGGFFGAWGGHE